MAAGEAWIFDNWRRHSVVNPHTADRIHLVADTAGSSAFWQFVAEGQRGAPPREHRFDKCAEYTPQRELVADRLWKLERLRELGGWTAAAHARGRSASRQAPGAPAVRPQSFGHGATREPSKLSKLSNSERFELFVALLLERQQAQRQRSEEAPDLLVAYDE